MAEPIFHVPIVQQDLRQEETIVQIVDSLKFLQACATCVFAKVDARLDESAKKLHSVQARISKCKQKVDKLASTKKAAKVLSTAKYPASEIYRTSKSTFFPEDEITFCRSDYEVKSNIIVPYKNIQEKMQFFHVKNNNRMLRKNLDIASEEGLGKLPRNITSISSLLLFNTTENPYKTNLADRFGLHYRVKHAIAEPEESKPKQITPMKANNVEPDTKVGFYSPSMVQVPELDIPMDLPNLPGIADGLEFLMDFDTLSPMAPPPAPLPVAAAAPVRTLEAPVALVAPPPLPQMLAPAVVIPPAPPSVVAPPAAPSSAAPPPPPPPPPPQTVAPSFVEATSTSNTKPKAAKEASGDMRSSLMAAIRQAGGSNKLRSVSDKKMESKKKKQEEKEKVVSGDLMADLHAKLLLRRTGISGQNKPDGGGGMMEKISAMIPPPPVGGAAPQHCDSEEGSDWEP